MNVFLLLVLFILCKHLVICEINGICNQIKGEIYCKNAFRLQTILEFRNQTILALFCEVNGINKVIKVKLTNNIKHSNADNMLINDIWPKYDSSDIELWDEWLKSTNQMFVTELDNFVSAYQFSDSISNPLIFTVFDRNIGFKKYLNGFYVYYDSEIREIRTIEKFFIDPYRVKFANDQMNLFSFYQYFPSDFLDRVTPIVPVPETNADQRKVLVYYYEENPKNPKQKSYMIHIFNQTKQKDEWIYDETSGLCVGIDTNNRVMASVVVFSTKTNTSIQFYMLEFYNNGKYGVKRVTMYQTNNINQYSLKNVIKTGKIKDLLCLNYDKDKNHKTLTDDSSSVTTGEVMESAAESAPKNGSKSSKKWIFFGIIVIFIVVVAVIAVCTYIKKRKRSPPTTSSQDSDGSDETDKKVNDGNTGADNAEKDKELIATK